MAQQVLFVSEERLKAYTSLNTNLSPEDLQPYVFDSGQIMLPHYLGGTYYNALRDRVIAGTITAADENLLDVFIGPYLCNYAYYMALPFVWARSYNKGVMKATSESGVSLELDEFKFLQSQIKSIAESYAGQMVNHLLTHPNEFPLYNAARVKDGELPDRSSPFTANIVVPGMGYGNGNRRMAGYYGNNPFGYWGGLYNGLDCYNLPGT
jgi:hypothetical protein